jgi:integrase
MVTTGSRKVRDLERQRVERLHADLLPELSEHRVVVTPVAELDDVAGWRAAARATARRMGVRIRTGVTQTGTVASMTGARRGEVTGLKWADLDFDGATVTVARQVTAVGRELSFTAPKTDRGRRTIDLDDETVAVLRAHRARPLEQHLALGAGWQDHDLVFTAVDGHPLHPERIGTTFDRLVRRSGLPKIRLHDLRRTPAGHLLAAGVHPQALAARLGHATPASTLQRCGHLIPLLGASAARAVADLVDGPSGG